MWHTRYDYVKYIYIYFFLLNLFYIYFLGVVLIFSTFLCILWCFFLILHLHLQTVWRSSFFQRHHIIPQTLVMIAAITFTSFPVVMSKISYEFGTVCFVSKFTNEVFWYPLAIFVIPGFLMHS